MILMYKNTPVLQFDVDGLPPHARDFSRELGGL